MKLENHPILFTQLNIEQLTELIEDSVSKVIGKMNIPKNPIEDKSLYTRDEVKNLLNVSFPTLFNWNRDGTLPITKIGNRVYYSKDLILSKINK